MKSNVNQLVHDQLANYLGPTRIAVDATCGNGHDTVFLASHCKHVFAFDVQSLAIQATAQALAAKSLTNVTLIHDTHAHLGVHIPADTIVDVAMFNLGYLPNSDKSIITRPESTIAAVEQILNRLAVGGILSLTVYTGHDGGCDESRELERYLRSLDKHDVTILKLDFINRKSSPYAILIERMR